MTYQLTEYQYTNLVKAANAESIVFAELEPNTVDSPERQTELYNKCKALRELIGIGLLEDVSDKFKEGIELSKINNNRTFIVVALTKDAVSLFRNMDKRLPN